MKRRLTIGCLLGLIICCGFSYQNNFLEKIQEKLSLYYETNLPMKINLFLNQPAYTTSDTIYFRISLLTAANARRVAGYAVINVNLVDGKNKIVHHQKIRIKDGIGSNQIAIPSTVKPGIYNLVAYNDWMKNHDKSLFAFYEINIVGEKAFTRHSKSFDFEVFAEGGHLIEGITNKIVFTGMPFEKVKISGSKGVIFPDITLNDSGLGAYFITPVNGIEYQAVMGSQVTSLQVEKDGVGLVTKISPSDTSARCILQVPETSVLREEGVYFVWSAGEYIYYGAKVDFKKSNQGIVNIPARHVPKGVSLISVFDHADLILAQRMIEIPEGSTKVKLQTERETYGTRDKVTVTLNNLGKGKLIGWMTVFNTDLFETEEINAYRKQSALMQTDLPFKGLRIPQKIIDDRDIVQLNDFLITQPWKNFSWKDVFNAHVKNQFPFREDLVISGKASYRDDMVFQGSPQITFFLQKDATVYQIETDLEGNFDFPLIFDFYGEDEVYYRVEDSNGILKDVDMKISTDTFSFPFDNQIEERLGQNKYALFSTNRRTVNTAFSLPTQSKPAANRLEYNAKLEKEVLGADVTIQLKDYVLFPTMEETLLEVIPFLRYQKKAGKSHVKLWLDDNTTPAQDPLYMIDGVLTADSDYFMSLLPENVVSIKLIRSIDKLGKLGIFGKNGVVLVETKIRDNYLKVRRSEEMFSMQGLTKSRPSAMWSPGKLNDRIPRIHSTLYFNPNLESDENGNATISFYTGDNTGNFKVYVQGFQADGKPFTIEQNFQVEFKPTEN